MYAYVFENLQIMYCTIDGYFWMIAYVQNGANETRVHVPNRWFHEINMQTGPRLLTVISGIFY